MWRDLRSPPYVRENGDERGLSVRGKREPSRAGSNTSPTWMSSPSPSSAGHTEDGRITRVRVTVDLHKLLQAATTRAAIPPITGPPL